MASIKSERTGKKPTKDRTLENKTRVTLNGERLRVGNPKHPFHKIYLRGGHEAVYEAMGVITPPKRLAQTYSRAAKAIFDATKEGYIYIVWNPSWPEWVKVGMAVDAEDRVETFNTACPFRNYQIAKAYFTQNRFDSERNAHELMTAMSEDRKGEWFKINWKDAIATLDTIL